MLSKFLFGNLPVKAAGNWLHPAINWLIKGTIAAFLLFTIYEQVLGREDAVALWTAWEQQLGSGREEWLLLVILLLPVNWALEAGKWRYLLSPFWEAPFGQVFRAVLAGVSLSLFTPNRVGEYIGRMMAVPARHNTHAVLAMLAGSYAQLLVILSLGAVGALYFLNTAVEHFQSPSLWWWWGALPALAALLLAFFNLGRLASLARVLPIPRKALRVVLMLRHYRRRQLGIALALALLRYGVYSFQYYGLLVFFGVGAPPAAAFAGIATIFLVQTSLPLPPAFALLLRGEAALVVWGAFSPQPWGILAATFGLFIINLCLPALLGLVFIVRINVLKSLGYENDVIQNEPPERPADLSHGFRPPRKN